MNKQNNIYSSFDFNEGFNNNLNSTPAMSYSNDMGNVHNNYNIGAEEQANFPYYDYSSSYDTAPSYEYTSSAKDKNSMQTTQNRNQATTNKNFESKDSISFYKEMSITEKYGSNTLVSASMRSFNINKLLLTFCEFDKQTKKRTKKIDIYIGFEDFFKIYSGILEDGKYYKEAVNKFNQKGEKSFSEPVSLISGGTSAEALRKQNKSRPDGKSLYRGLNMTFMLSKSNEPTLYMQAISGAGRVNEKTHGIVIEKIEEQVGVAFSINELSGFLKICSMYINAYINMRVQKVHEMFKRGENIWKYID